VRGIIVVVGGLDLDTAFGKDIEETTERESTIRWAAIVTDVGQESEGLEWWEIRTGTLHKSRTGGATEIGDRGN
jgi:hypothetical protein